MTVVMGSLNLPFLYRVIIFISEAVILKYSSHLVLTLPSATFLIQGNAKAVVFVVRKDNNQSQKTNDLL